VVTVIAINGHDVTVQDSTKKQHTVNKNHLSALLKIPEEYIITKAQRDLLLRKDLNSNLQKAQVNKGALGVTGLNLIQGLTKPRTRRKRSGSFSEALPQPDKYFLHREAPPLGFKNNRRRLSEVDRLNRRIQQQTAYMQRERQ